MRKIVYDGALLKRHSASLQAIPKNVLEMIKYKIESAATDNYPHLYLTGTLKGFCKLKIAQYRVIYSVDEKENVLRVHKIGHRHNIYNL